MTFACWLWSVVKDMAQMAAATTTMDLGPDAQQKPVISKADIARNWFPEAGPTGAALKFRARRIDC
jgi:hypothetical protein